MLKLNLGCGSNFLEGWINHDRDVNITKTLPYDSNSVDAIFAEHVIEHITSSELTGFILECHRVLVPGGKLRLVFPDFMKIVSSNNPEYVKFASDYVPDEHRHKDYTPVYSIAACHGHKQLLTIETMLVLVGSLGFRSCEAKLYNFGLLDDEPTDGHHLVITREYHELESSAIEAVRV